MKNTILLIILMGLFLNCSSTYGDEKQKEIETKIPVRTKLLNPEKYIKTYSGTGKVISSQQANLMFEVPGKIIEVIAKTGQYFKTGEVIAKLKSDIYKAQFDLAESALKKAKRDLKNVTELFNKNAVSEDQLLQAELGYKKSKSDYTNAKNAYENTELKAPFNGTITHINLQEGEFFSPGPYPLPPVIISNLNQLQLETTISSTEITNINLNQNVKITSPLNTSSIAYNGIVEEVGMIPINMSNSYNVKINILNSNSDLKLGMMFNYIIEQIELDSVYMISNRYILEENGESFLWMNDNSIAKKIYISTGNLVEHKIIIKGELYPGMMIVTDGIRQVKEGSSLKVIQ